MKKLLTLSICLLLSITCISCSKKKENTKLKEKEQAYTQEQQSKYNQLYTEKYEELMPTIQVTDDEIDDYLKSPNYKKPIKAVDVDTETGRTTYFITEEDVEPKVGDAYMSGTVAKLRDIDDNERKQLASDYLISKKYDNKIREMVKDGK